MRRLPAPIEPVDEYGVPLPWVPSTPPVEGLASPGDREGDAQSLGPDATLPLTPGEPPPLWLHEALKELCGRAELPLPELIVRPVATPRRGFCSGRVWMRGHRPLRVLLRPGPNSDEAEILATLAHELAHPKAARSDHGVAFKEALLNLARLMWGEQWFASADPRTSYRDVDRWISTGLRASLAHREPPRPRTGDEGQTARIVARIRKLHALAEHRPGEPEARTAAGRANDLVTIYGLGGYQVQIDAGIDEQMVDRWVVLKRRAVWNRQLGHAVARFFGVFSLAMARQGRMHFFGRHADVVGTVYLVEICRDKILRACDRHISAWKIEMPRTAGETRSERVRFCDNAVFAFSQKLDAIRDIEPGTESALDEAEDFALEEHRKRGAGWRTARRRTIERHEAGQAAGRALEVVRGVSGGGGPKRIC
jgi:hypothetical protein